MYLLLCTPAPATPTPKGHKIRRSVNAHAYIWATFFFFTIKERYFQLHLFRSFIPKLFFLLRSLYPILSSMLPYTVQSSKVQCNEKTQTILSSYDYQTTRVDRSEDGKLTVTPVTSSLLFKTDAKVPKIGVMLVGWGGNNGSTVTASILANKLGISWRTKEGDQVSSHVRAWLRLQGSITWCQCDVHHFANVVITNRLKGRISIITLVVA